MGAMGMGAGSDCPDNLSKVMFWSKVGVGRTDGADVEQEPGAGAICMSFASSYGYKRIAIADNDMNIVTKAAVAHPDGAHVSVGILALKRVFCEGGALNKNKG